MVLHTVPLSAVNGLSRLTTTCNGQAWPIRKCSNRPITFQSNRNGLFEFESNVKASRVPNIVIVVCLLFGTVYICYIVILLLMMTTTTITMMRTMTTLMMMMITMIDDDDDDDDDDYYDAAAVSLCCVCVQ